ncbi:MAG: HD domain-containing protein [Firmicutes bacterium]|nr:HD domain-containing protein [Bacillota bacterium]
MKFNLVNFLQGISISLDYIEKEIFGVPTNHSKRVAYISYHISSALSLPEDQVFDLLSLAILHDNGASLAILHEELKGTHLEKRLSLETAIMHCTMGEKNLVDFPFLTKPKNVILYHHENCDGSGFFGIKGDKIPLLAQIIHLSDMIDLNFNLTHIPSNPVLKNQIIDFVQKNNTSLFSNVVVNAFLEISNQPSFWEGLSDDIIDENLEKSSQGFDFEMESKTIRKITKTFSKVIDSKSSYTHQHSNMVAATMKRMAKFYHLNKEESSLLVIAADLHDLGKLGISKSIIEKPGPLTIEEFKVIQEHPTIAYECLKNIIGFEKITEWIYNHHEKLDGSGYPRGLTKENLDFGSRLIACIDIYTALQEDRPYRKAMSKETAYSILSDMAMKGLIDLDICQDIYQIFHQS